MCWKEAGAAYLPLDESHPAGRLETILSDSGAEILVTEEIYSSVAENLAVKPAYLDTDGHKIAQNEGGNLELELSDNNPVYVIYTSGTTGAPKGVCVEHRNLTNYCDAIWSEMKLSANDKFATVSSPAADLGNTMIFPPLLNGASVVIVPQDMATDAAGLSAYFEQNPVDCLKIVPSHLHALLRSEKAKHILPAKLLVLGGEAASDKLIETIREIDPLVRILNHYGPTECTIGVLTCEYKENSGAPPSLGFPLAGNRVYVLDKNRRPVPVGIAGELYIGGAQVARGYLNRPELNGERFIENPFLPDERLYRTGDKAKILADGAVAFLGRVDRQVKIRGFRVELPEIENILSRHADVESAVVLPPADDDARQQLTAYIKTKPGTTASAIGGAQALKEYLGEQLPGYMIPGAFVFVGAIPLTANGKIDYVTLSQLEIEAPEIARKAPRDQTELELLQIWQELLGSIDIGIDDNFFDVGGHSLLAVQLMSRIDENFGRRLSLASLFEHATVEQIAKLLRADEIVKQSSPLVCIMPGAADNNLFFVHPAGGNVLCYYELARGLGGDFTFYGLQTDANGSGEGSSRASVTEMARKYLAAISPARADTTPVFGGWSMGALVAFEMARLYVLEHERLPVVAVLDQIAPEVSAVSANGSQDRDIDDTSRLLAFAGKVSQLIGKDLGVTSAALSGGDFAEQTAVFLDKFKAAALVPENTDVAGFRGFLELMLVHNRITAEYSPGVYPGKILVFRAENSLALDPEVSAAAGISAHRAPDLGWQKYSSRPVTVIPVPGNHVSMMAAPNVQRLAERLAQQVILERNKNDDKNTLSRSG